MFISIKTNKNVGWYIGYIHHKRAKNMKTPSSNGQHGDKKKYLKQMFLIWEPRAYMENAI